MRFRQSYNDERHATADARVRAQEERSLQTQLAEFTETVSQLAVHLKAHPEFPYADDARLERSGLLIFLGRCGEAALELRHLHSNEVGSSSEAVPGGTSLDSPRQANSVDLASLRADVSKGQGSRG